MHGMAQAVGELTEQGSPAFEAALPILSQLLKAETADREVRSTAYQLKAARFPNYRDLAGFDFASSEVNEALVRQLHRCEFLEDAHNAVLVGGPGTGKTHLATAIGVQASNITANASASSPPSISSTPSNRKASGQSRADRSAAREHSDLVILDELGYLPFAQAGGALLFHLLSRLYERTCDHRHHQSRLRRMAERVRRAEAFMMPPSWNAWYVADEHGVDRSARPRDRFATVALSSAGGQPSGHAPDSRTRFVT